MPTEYITRGEWTNWRQEEHDFRQRLERRMAEQHAETQGQLTEVIRLQRDANGRIARSEEAMRVFDRDLQAVKSEDRHIEQIVESIKEDGCSQYQTHIALMTGGDPTDTSRTINLAVLSKRQKMIGGAGLAIVMWPALQQIAATLADVIHWLEAR